ncbi:hypothetical protein ABMA28_015863 [Loxostege sticticalis]|uniref:Uncharacterized protein n=1 Tax=Loxostege sticticalis TaxID=481309 RepID=A0ABD0TD93_LOXSC
MGFCGFGNVSKSMIPNKLSESKLTNKKQLQITDPKSNSSLSIIKTLLRIEGKPVIQQRILPSPVVSIDAPQGRSVSATGDENSNIIFSPWKAFGPFVDTIQDGELLPSQDTVVLPTPRHQFTSVDEDATDPMPTTETSNKVASISQLSFMVRPDSFERGQLRLTCISSVHSVYSEQAELVINEERPQIASVLGTRDDARGKCMLTT